RPWARPGSRARPRLTIGRPAPAEQGRQSVSAPSSVGAHEKQIPAIGTQKEGDMRKRTTMVAAAVLLAGVTGGRVRAASHSDAPLIKQDPQANITDVYAFVGTRYDNSDIRVLNVVVQVRPFSEPGDGVIYDRFASDARYSVHIANPSTGATLRRY